MLKEGELKFKKNRVSCNGVSFTRVMLGYVKHLWRGLQHKRSFFGKEDYNNKEGMGQ